jgi:beta-galactosidase
MRQYLLTALLALTLAGTAQNRQETTLGTWDFSRDGQTWQQVRVPHDWAIEGPFDKKWDIQYVAIAQDGQDKPLNIPDARAPCLDWRRPLSHHLHVPATDKHNRDLLRRCHVRAVVYVNGREAGRWAYGYNAFRLDITHPAEKGHQ